jgi:hypothetical protein
MKKITIRVQLKSAPQKENTLLFFLAYLAYLRSIQSQSALETKTLKLLIFFSALVLITLILVGGGASDKVGEVLRSLPPLP